MTLTPNINTKQSSHMDLIKFGLDMTQQATPASSPTNSSFGIESLLSYFEIPTITFACSPTNLVRIIRNKCKKTNTLVDRQTGFMLEDTSEFSDIYKFDQQTFPKDKDDINIKEVAYWNKANKYITSS